MKLPGGAHLVAWEFNKRWNHAAQLQQKSTTFETKLGTFTLPETIIHAWLKHYLDLSLYIKRKPMYIFSECELCAESLSRISWQTWGTMRAINCTWHATEIRYFLACLRVHSLHAVVQSIHIHLFTLNLVCELQVTSIQFCWINYPYVQIRRGEIWEPNLDIVEFPAFFNTSNQS